MAFTRRIALSLLLVWAIVAGGVARGDDCAGQPDARPALVAKNAEPWDTLQIWVRDPPTSAEAAQAEINRIGGSHLLLEIDYGDVRKVLLEILRDDTRRVLRDARITWARPPLVRERSVEVQIRDADVERALNLFAEAIAIPLDRSSERSVDISDMGNGIIRLTVTESAVRERIGAAQQRAVEILERRANGLGLVNPYVRGEGLGRIRAAVPGLFDPGHLLSILDSRARLTLQLIDTSISGCDVADKQVPPDAEIFYAQGGKTPYLVKRQPLVEFQEVIDAVVALDRESHAPMVVFRLDARAGHRFAKATQENVGQRFAIALDNTVIAAPLISEPLRSIIQISGIPGLREAEELATILRGGPGMSRLLVVNQQIVQPPPSK